MIEVVPNMRVREILAYRAADGERMPGRSVEEVDLDFPWRLRRDGIDVVSRTREGAVAMFDRIMEARRAD